LNLSNEYKNGEKLKITDKNHRQEKEKEMFLMLI